MKVSVVVPVFNEEANLEEFLRRLLAVMEERREPFEVILVDDGLATGSTMRAAVRALRRQEARQIVVAVPVGAPSTCAELEEEADEVLCAATPQHFRAVGLWYDDFSQTTDEEVREAGGQEPEPSRGADQGRAGEEQGDSENGSLPNHCVLLSQLLERRPAASGRSANAKHIESRAA